MMTDGRKNLLAGFVGWVAQHVRGDEKGEAQIYLDRLFQAFGQKGLLEAGGQAEFRLKKAVRGQIASLGVRGSIAIHTGGAASKR